MFYACIAIGQADYLPDEQIYVSAPDPYALGVAIGRHLLAFDDEEAEAGSRPAYRHAFRQPRNEYETNWSQRLRISRDGDRVVDVIGMTAAEYAEQGEA